MERRVSATKKEAQNLTNGKKKHRVVEDVGSGGEGGGGDDSEDVEPNTETVQKRVGCTHYKRRAKFVVSFNFIINFNKN